MRHLLRKFPSPVYGLGFAVVLAACSGSDDPPGGGSAGSSNTGATGGSENTSGSSNTSGSNNAGSGNAGGSGGTAGTGPSDSMELVGSFQVQVTASAEDESSGTTTAIGKVNDGPSPSSVKWTVEQEDGDCRLEIPSAPFCDGGCSGDVCVDDGVCKPYPQAKTVGEVTLKGVVLDGGGDEVTLREVAKAYQPPAGTLFAYPPFEERAKVTVTATGGDYAAFSLEAEGVAPLTITATDLELDVNKALELTWNAASAPEASKIHVKLDISHHGGSRGQIICETSDSGAVTISAALMTELIGLGVAGFPSVIMTRSSTGSTQIEVGRVELAVTSKSERFVTVAGFESCTEDEDCEEGQTCQADLTCM